MTWNLTLDILLVLLILLFAPIGYMRGPVKEIFVTLGVVFGALLAPYWAQPWGQDLDSYFDLGDDPGAFVVSVAILMSATFIGGYGLGLLMSSWEHSIPGRVLGAMISAFNGALLVGFCLQYVRLFLLSDANEDSLEASFVVDFLVNEIGWVLLGGAVAVIPVLAFGLATGRRAYRLGAYEDESDYDDYPDYDLDYEDYDEEYEEEAPTPLSVVSLREPAQPSRDPSAETRTLPPRVPGKPDEQAQRLYKPDPEPEDEDVVALTRPLTVSKQSEEPSTKPEGASSPTGDTDPEMTIYLPGEELEDIEESPAEQPADQQDELPDGYFRCRTCQAVLPPGAKYCSVCGQEQG